MGAGPTAGVASVMASPASRNHNSLSAEFPSVSEDAIVYTRRPLAPPDALSQFAPGTTEYTERIDDTRSDPGSTGDRRTFAGGCAAGGEQRSGGHDADPHSADRASPCGRASTFRRALLRLSPSRRLARDRRLSNPDQIAAVLRGRSRRAPG